MDDKIQEMLEQFPFLSYGRMSDVPYVGVIQNCDNQLLSIYVYTSVPTKELRKKFIKLADNWWWQSNRQVPISIFDKEFRIFRPFLKHFSRKDFELISGPTVSLQESMVRRVRKRQITLVRPVKD